MMNVYDYAMQMEKEGEEFYRELAEKTSNGALKGVLNLLADEEVQHYEYIKTMKEQSGSPDLTASNLRESAKNVFLKIKKEKIDFDFSTSAAEMYRKAAKHEDAAIAFYTKKAEESTDPTHKAIFLKLAEEEQLHKELMDHMADFVSEPEQWLEDAEFVNV